MQCLLLRRGQIHYDFAAQKPPQLTTQCHFEVHLFHPIHARRCRRPIQEQLLPPGSVCAGAQILSNAVGRGLRLRDSIMEDAASGSLSLETIPRIRTASKWPSARWIGKVKCQGLRLASTHHSQKHHFFVDAAAASPLSTNNEQRAYCGRGAPPLPGCFSCLTFPYALA